MTLRVRRALLSLLIVLVFPFTPARADTIDDVEVRPGPAGTTGSVLHIRFNGRVQFERTTPDGESELALVYFRVVALDDPNAQVLVEETRISPAGAPGPAFSLSYPFQAKAPVRQLRLRFNQGVTVSAREGSDGRSIDVVVTPAGGAAKSTAPAASAAPAAASVTAPATAAAAVPSASVDVSGTVVPIRASKPSYALRLLRVEHPETAPAPLIPQELGALLVFNNPLPGPGKGYELVAGYFEDEASAESMRQRVLKRFPDAVVFDADARKSENLASAAAGAGGSVAKPATLPGTEGSTVSPSTTPGPGDTEDIAARADELLGEAADAVTASRFGDAIASLNQALLLPPNPSTQTAQELIGVARERAGDVAGARAEYERYLKLFPEGEAPDRVRQRLANLPAAPAAGQPAVADAAAAASAAAAAAPGAGPASGGPPPPPATEARSQPRSISGSISQFYYGGVMRATTILNSPVGINQASLSGITQSAIVTNLDLTARYHDADSDSRMVLRDTNSSSLINSAHGTNLLSAAYIDYRNLATSLGVRVGRQSAASAGALGLFDGISVGYSPTQRLRLTASAGQPSDPLTAPHERFEGFDAQVDEVLAGLGLGAYGINQTVDGAVSRRALGIDLRYFTPKYSLYAASDHDVAFHATNSFVIQGTMTTEQQEVLSLLLDHRRVPSLDLGNALIGSTFTSLQTMLQQLGYAQVQELAAQVAAVSRQGVLSYSRPLSERWQGSADVRWTDVGALPAVGLAPAQPATGAQMGYSLIATGSNLYSKADTNVFNLSVLNSTELHGGQIAYNNLTGFWQNTLSLEPSVRLYLENNSSGQHTERLTPGFRAAYRLGPAVSLESEAILEWSKVSGTTSEDARNAFFYVGYRYDFR